MANFMPVLIIQNVNIQKIFPPLWELNAQNAKGARLLKEGLERKKSSTAARIGRNVILPYGIDPCLAGRQVREKFVQNVVRF